MSNSKKKHSPWSYVVQSDDKPVGAFPSASLAYFVWKAWVDFVDRSYKADDRPFISCNRYRALYDPFKLEAQDVTLNFMRMWEIQNSKKDEKA